MVLNQQETKQQLLLLFENELKQEQMDAMVFAIQQRIAACTGHSLSEQEVNKIVYDVYREHTQALRRRSLPLLKRLGDLLRQRRWEDPGVIRLKKE